MTNADSWLIDKGSYYEIRNYKPILTYDENHNITSVIHCPYIPKFFVDGPDLDSIMVDRIEATGEANAPSVAKK